MCLIAIDANFQKRTECAGAVEVKRRTPSREGSVKLGGGLWCLRSHRQRRFESWIRRMRVVGVAPRERSSGVAWGCMLTVCCRLANGMGVRRPDLAADAHAPTRSERRPKHLRLSQIG